MALYFLRRIRSVLPEIKFSFPLEEPHTRSKSSISLSEIYYRDLFEGYIYLHEKLPHHKNPD